VTGVTVVLCPALDDAGGDSGESDRRELAAALAGWGIPVVVPHPTRYLPEDDERLSMAAWVADQAVAITGARTSGPLILVCRGSANRAVPALGFAQRASRRSVVAYVLIDGPLPDAARAGSDWPDAPVVYVSSTTGPDPSLRAAELRGWPTVAADPIEAVTGIARGWPDSMP
jgi:hypothetical protein